ADERGEIGRDVVGKARRDALLVRARRAALGLGAPRRRGEDDVAVVGHARSLASAVPMSQRLRGGTVGQREYDRSAENDNWRCGEDIIAIIAIIWIAPTAWRCSRKSWSTAALPRRRGGLAAPPRR